MTSNSIFTMSNPIPKSKIIIFSITNSTRITSLVLHLPRVIYEQSNGNTLSHLKLVTSIGVYEVTRIKIYKELIVPGLCTVKRKTLGSHEK